MDINQQCKLCQNGLETRDHVFVCCEFTRAIWRKLMAWIKWPIYTLDSWDTHLKWIIEKARGNTLTAQLFKLMYAECSHAVWIERNHKFFKDKIRNLEHIAKEVAYMCYMRAHKAISSRLQQLSFI
ncbi:hypothetical protein R3W88_019029 [Solanum pinnatisectum]|uniref:Reverse transcriptase zinc-binding domain-containing protein n=1 Tax=Solanum pinnatisectum TaxID=50273 RepID=A0AAV9KID2_9SOLN|nr:hypothetical protein R3W88_019029 [Solanum pinnatisectum]